MGFHNGCVRVHFASADRITINQCFTLDSGLLLCFVFPVFALIGFVEDLKAGLMLLS